MLIIVYREYLNKTDVEVLKCLSSKCNFPEKLLNFYFENIAEEDEVESVAAIVMRIVQSLDVGLVWSYYNMILIIYILKEKKILKIVSF